MKLLVLAFSLMSFQAFAGDTYICIEKGGDEYSPKKMILSQVGSGEVKEGKVFAFKLEIYENNKLIVSESVNVLTEDVIFRFTNTAKKIAGRIYLDEMEDTFVNVGKNKYKFDCR